MSGVANGQDANEDTFNNAFMARNGDTDTVGRVDLLHAASAHIIDIQTVINTLIKRVLWRHETPTGVLNGANQAFAVVDIPLAHAAAMVFIDGVKRNKTEYTLAGSTFTFLVAPDAGSEMEIVYVAD